MENFSENDTLNRHEVAQGDFKSYVIGFLISIILTLAAFYLAIEHVLTGFTFDITIAILSLVQVYFQLTLFLHLGHEPRPQWNLYAFWFMLLVVGILVFGSLWIMFNLDYRMMPIMDHAQKELTP